MNSPRTMKFDAVWRSLSVALAILMALPAADADEDPAKPESEKKTDAKPAAPVPEAVPKKASVKELHDYMERINDAEKFPEFKSRAELIGYVQKVSRNTIAAAERVLAPTTDAKTAKSALEFAFDAYIILGRTGDADAGDEAKKFAEKLLKDKRPPVAQLARRFLIITRAELVPYLDKKEQAKLFADATDYFSKSELETTDVVVAYLIASGLEQSRNIELAAKAYKQFAATFGKKFAKTDDPEVKELLSHLQGSARRYALPGNEIEISGTATDGTKIDIKDYKGKVVLVDFWATWCRTCIIEMPAVLALHKQYHKQGFEVLGVSLDEQPTAAAEFLKLREIPWKSIVADDPLESGWDLPVARRYGISALPATVLVDAKGKVVALDPTTAEVEKYLEKTLKKPDESKPKQPKSP